LTGLPSNRTFRATAALMVALLVPFTAAAQDGVDALQLYRDGRFEEAIEVCRNELEELPRNMDSYTVMGWSLLALRRYEEAYNEARRALSIEPFDQRIIEIAGEAQYYLGNNREALYYFEQYVSIAPSGRHIAVVYYYMGEIFIRIGRYNNADIALSTALHFDSKDARWWSRLGYARMMREDYQWALEAYENALKLNPNLVEAREGLETVRRNLSGG